MEKSVLWHDVIQDVIKKYGASDKEKSCHKPAEKAEEPTENYISHFHKAPYWEKIKNNDSEAKTKVAKFIKKRYM